jgi:sulfur-carrier protein
MSGGKAVQLFVASPVIQRAVLDKLEAQYPMLRGTIREHSWQERRAFMRFFADGQDFSHVSPDAHCRNR